MAQTANTQESPEVVEIDLRQPLVAALWAWLWPGAGHLYQRRWAKGVLFMTCILGTYFFGLAMGDGHVVYASFRPGDNRWQYICQVGVGAPALPALIQSYRVKERMQSGLPAVEPDIMAPPEIVDPENQDELAGWIADEHPKFDLGTLYTIVAGLLNVLAIYDAYAGPLAPPAPKDPKKPRSGDPDSA